MKAFWIISAICFLGCGKKDPVPYVNTGQELLINGDVESGSNVPDAWMSDAPIGLYETSWSTEAAMSGSHSLKISILTGDPSSMSWSQYYQGVMPVGKPLLLTAKVKGELRGTGVALAIGGDVAGGGPAAQFVTTQGTTPISGTFGWTTYQLKITKVPAEIGSYTVYLIFLPNTSGKVYFDDITLTY